MMGIPPFHANTYLQIRGSRQTRLLLFFSDSSAVSHLNKLNKLQTSCLRSIIGALRSTPSPAIEFETSCQPLHIKAK